MGNQYKHPHPALRKRRLLVSGGSRLTLRAEKFMKQLGCELATEESLLIITGGLERRVDAPGTIAADFAIFEGLKKGLKENQELINSRIETILPSSNRDWNENLERFEAGVVKELVNRNAQTRRSVMVNSADVIVTIEGGAGTRSVIDLAIALEKPVLPLPFGKGESLKKWKNHAGEIKRWFHLDDDEVQYLELVTLDNDSVIEQAAKEVKKILFKGKGFEESCFVMMPFADDFDEVYDECIDPVLQSLNILPVMLKNLYITGSVVDTIKSSISNCKGAIADITGNNANVMYELGLAHAENKPVVIICKGDSDGRLKDIPFDVMNHNIIPYTDDFELLRNKLTKVFSELYDIRVDS